MQPNSDNSFKQVRSFMSLGIVVVAVLLALFGVQSASAASSASTGGAAFVAPPPPLTPGQMAKISEDGRTAIAPADAPTQVQQAIFAINTIVNKPYIYGGGHKSFDARGYDCSGTVSFALHGGGLLDSPLDSSSFMRWGLRGPGQWITIYTNPGHAWATIAGLRLDTSGPGERGPRWRAAARSTDGYRVRHVEGF